MTRYLGDHDSVKARTIGETSQAEWTDIAASFRRPDRRRSTRIKNIPMYSSQRILSQIGAKYSRSIVGWPARRESSCSGGSSLRVRKPTSI